MHIVTGFQQRVEYYTDLIHSKKEWTLAGIFADEGISGTQTKANVESVLAGMEQSEIKKIEERLKEIDKSRNDMIALITSGSCDEDTLDTEFAKLYEEETQLSGKLLSLKAQCKISDDTKDKVESTIVEIENSRFQLEAFDDVLIRKLIECVKVISKTEIIIIFKGGYEVKAEVEKK